MAGAAQHPDECGTRRVGQGRNLKRRQACPQDDPPPVLGSAVVGRVEKPPTDVREAGAQVGQATRDIVRAKGRRDPRLDGAVYTRDLLMARLENK